MTSICFQVANAQVIQVSVGEKLLLASVAKDTVLGSCSTKSTAYSCLYPFHFFLKSNGTGGNTPSHYPPYYGIKNELYFYADSAGEFNDTLDYYYDPCFVGSKCSFSPCAMFKLLGPHYFSVKVVRDSAVKISSVVDNTLVYYPDTSTHTFSGRNYSFNLFNTTLDTVEFSDWKFENTATIDFAALVTRDSNVIDGLSSPPNEYKIPLIVSLTPLTSSVNYERMFEGALSVHALSKHIDTLLHMPFNVILKQDPTTGVDAAHVVENSLRIFPNPTQNEINVAVGNSKKAFTTISIFDEIGKEVKSILNDFLDEGDHQLTTKLPTGMYYVRMQTGDEVVTRKVTVVR